MNDSDDDSKFSIHHLRGSDEEMDFIFSNLFNAKYPILLNAEKRWHPPTDVIETDDEFLVVMDIASVRQEDISLLYESGVLKVSGLRRDLSLPEKKHFHKMEIDFGSFERKVKINARIVDQSIKAAYENGFLVVRLKKDTSKASKVTKIVIE